MMPRLTFQRGAVPSACVLAVAASLLFAGARPAAAVPLVAPSARGTPAPEAAAGSPSAGPRLVVVFSIDQGRADYLSRFRDLFLPAREGARVGGFRWLMEEGAWFLDARHDHYPLETGPGYAVLLTGAPPYKNGIVANDWYDRASRRLRNCVLDPDSPPVGGDPNGRPASPATLRVSTVGDEMEIATGGRAKVWGVSLKDRSAIFMAGHLADGALWYDTPSGQMVTSRWYAKDGVLPAPAVRVNGAAGAGRYFGRTWAPSPSIPAAAFEGLFSRENRHTDDRLGLGRAFPHEVTGALSAPGRDFYRAIWYTPYANEMVLEAAREIVTSEGLGRDVVPDLLAIGLSGNDAIGHMWGPDSPEVLDITVRTDRAISEFLNELAAGLPGGLEGVVVVLASDHGVGPVVADARLAGLPAGAYTEAAIEKAAEEALDAAFGADDWVEVVREPHLWLRPEAIARRKVPAAGAEEAAAAALERLDAIVSAYARTRILEGRLPDTEIARRVSRSYVRDRSGDVVWIPRPYFVSGDSEKGATHGTPYAYDTHVPLAFAGAGIRRGVRAERVSTFDIAPTLAALLGILPPSGSEGRILGEALEGIHRP